MFSFLSIGVPGPVAPRISTGIPSVEIQVDSWLTPIPAPAGRIDSVPRAADPRRHHAVEIESVPFADDADSDNLFCDYGS